MSELQPSEPEPEPRPLVYALPEIEPHSLYDLPRDLEASQRTVADIVDFIKFSVEFGLGNRNDFLFRREVILRGEAEMVRLSEYGFFGPQQELDSPAKGWHLGKRQSLEASIEFCYLSEGSEGLDGESYLIEKDESGALFIGLLQYDDEASPYVSDYISEAAAVELLKKVRSLGGGC